MQHIMPNGEIVIYRIDLSNLLENKFGDMMEMVSQHAYIVQQVPGKQVLKVYWNLVESPEEVIALPLGSVAPWRDSR